MIRASDYRDKLNAVLAHYKLPASSLELVPSVFQWCAANEKAETNKRRLAKCFSTSPERPCQIVMCDMLSDRAIAGARFAMEYRGFADEVESLSSDKLFLLHLLLHEIACHVLQTTEQEPRDRWAFDEMVKHDI